MGCIQSLISTEEQQLTPEQIEAFKIYVEKTYEYYDNGWYSHCESIKMRVSYRLGLEEWGHLYEMKRMLCLRNPDVLNWYLPDGQVIAVKKPKQYFNFCDRSYPFIDLETLKIVFKALDDKLACMYYKYDRISEDARLFRSIMTQKQREKHDEYLTWIDNDMM